MKCFSFSYVKREGEAVQSVPREEVPRVSKLEVVLKIGCGEHGGMGVSVMMTAEENRFDWSVRSDWLPNTWSQLIPEERRRKQENNEWRQKGCQTCSFLNTVCFKPSPCCSDRCTLGPWYDYACPLTTPCSPDRVSCLWGTQLFHQVLSYFLQVCSVNHSICLDWDDKYLKHDTGQASAPDLWVTGSFWVVEHEQCWKKDKYIFCSNRKFGFNFNFTYLARKMFFLHQCYIIYERHQICILWEV